MSGVYHNYVCLCAHVCVCVCVCMFVFMFTATYVCVCNVDFACLASCDLSFELFVLLNYIISEMFD